MYDSDWVFASHAQYAPSPPFLAGALKLRRRARTACGQLPLVGGVRADEPVLFACIPRVERSDEHHRLCDCELVRECIDPCARCYDRSRSFGRPRCWIRCGRCRERASDTSHPVFDIGSVRPGGFLRPAPARHAIRSQQVIDDKDVEVVTGSFSRRGAQRIVHFTSTSTYATLPVDSCGTRAIVLSRSAQDSHSVAALERGLRCGA
jgi:hypothetical protein